MSLYPGSLCHTKNTLHGIHNFVLQRLGGQESEYLGPTKVSSFEREHVLYPCRESLSHKEHFVQFVLQRLGGQGSIWDLRRRPLLRGSMSLYPGSLCHTKNTLHGIHNFVLQRLGGQESEYLGPTKVSSFEREHVLYPGSLCHTKNTLYNLSFRG